MIIFSKVNAPVTQRLECHPYKVEVDGSSPSRRTMGIQVEFNPDLALRNFTEFEKGTRKIEECIPAKIEAGKIYPFLKNGQRNYWFYGEIPLKETAGNQNLSRPKASVIITEASHIVQNNEMYTKGFYKVIEVFTDDQIHFEGLDRIK